MVIVASGWERLPIAINADRLANLHAVRIGGNQQVCGLDDMASGTVVFHQVENLSRVILVETADEFHIAAAERVNVLIIVSDGQDGEFKVGVIQRPAGNRADQLVLRLVNVLVFVHQDMLETGE